MKKGMGCGPLAAIIIVALVLIMFATNEAVGMYFSRCDEDDDFFGCILSELEEEAEEGEVAASGTYTYDSHSVDVTAIIPLAGGEVSGSFSGTCEGKVRGTYDARTGVISGKMTGACSPFFVNIPASARYSGSVNKASKTVPIGFNGEGGGIKHEGSMTLKYQ